MESGQLAKHLKYYAAYQSLYVGFVMALSSIGIFFHFLLDHEISIVEAWLHNNQWELLIVSKLASLYLLNRWFRIRMYELKSIRELVKQLVHWPETRALVIAVFMTASFIALGDVEYTGRNLGYSYYHFISFVSIFLFFAIEFIVIAYLRDVLDQKEQPPAVALAAGFTGLFTLSFRLSVPDYYNLLPYFALCYLALIVLSGRQFKSWSNVVCFLVLFVAPMGSLFGLDPVWGNDFSPFKLQKSLSMTLLGVVWVISFSYYRYRDRVVSYTRRFI